VDVAVGVEELHVVLEAPGGDAEINGFVDAEAPGAQGAAVVGALCG
jgi:hypothetical protein